MKITAPTSGTSLCQIGNLGTVLVQGDVSNVKFYLKFQNIFLVFYLPRNHYNSVFAARLMAPKSPNRSGLIVDISSDGGKMYFNIPAYGIGKAAVSLIT